MSKIEWTETTWNPVTGCTRISEGCERCYIERTPPMRMAHRRFDGPDIGATTGVQLHPDRLGKPLSWRKPRRIFVCSMADLFHDDIPDGYIARVFAVMATAPQHTFQVLTKRSARMRSLLSSAEFQQEVRDLADAVGRNGWDETWPAPNVWIGTSVESQKWARIRIPQLLETPAAVRWISAEPLLGPVDLFGDVERPGPAVIRTGVATPTDYGTGIEYDYDDQSGLDWVVVGGETGPGSRPMHPDWARSLRDQCTGAGVPFFFKQHGDWAPESMWMHDTATPAAYLSAEGAVRPLIGGAPAEPPTARGEDITIRLVGKKRAGRELDGRTWDEYPEVAS